MLDEEKGKIKAQSEDADSGTRAMSPSELSASQSLGVLQPGQIIEGKYKVLSLLGQGGMGSVYKVEQIFLHQELALKTLSSHSVSENIWRRFQKEARTASSLDHPSLVRLLDFGMIDNERPFFVMELIEGESLSSLIKKGPLSLDMVLSIFKQVCIGLASAHSAGVIHRDVKPGNIMICKVDDESSPKVKIVDFGIAKMISSEDAETINLTRTGEIFGTPNYMSPEQCLGLEVDNRADIYSVGCCLFEALTGTPPFMGDTALSVMMKHQSEDAPTLKQATLGKEFSEDLERLVGKLLAKDKGERYQNLYHVARDLQRIQEGLPVEMERQAQAQALHKNGLTKVWACAIAICAFAAGALITWLVSHAPAPKPTTVKPIALERDIKNTGEAFSVAISAGKLSAPHFSAPLDKNRYFHFPIDFKMGSIQVDNPSRAFVYEEKTSEFVPLPSNFPAHGEVVITPFYPFYLRVAKMLDSFDWLRHFRADEIHGLDFTGNVNFTDKEFQHFLHFQKLRTLIVGSNNEVNEGITDASIEYLNQFPLLTELNLPECKITGQGLAGLSRLTELTQLQAKGLSSNPLLMSRLGASRKMQFLDLPSCGLTDEDLAKISNIKGLCSLNLADNPRITPAGFSRLAHMKHLSILVMDHNPALMTDEVLATLKTLTLSDLTLDKSCTRAQVAHWREVLPKPHFHASR